MSKKWNEESLISNTNDIFLYSKRNRKLEILKREVACSNVSIFKNPYGDYVLVDLEGGKSGSRFNQEVLVPMVIERISQNP